MEKHASTQETVRGQNVFEWYEALISAALVLVLVFSLFFRIIQVDGESMVPTLQNGDKLIVWGAGYAPQRAMWSSWTVIRPTASHWSSVSLPRAAMW